MSLSICAACLSRLRISTRSSIPGDLTRAAWTQTTSFHTTAAQHQSPLVKKKVVMPGNADSGSRSRQSQSARLKKKTRERPKLPAVGERRAQRRRIVLSNTNAIPVSVEMWSKEKLTEEKYVGQMMALEGGLLDQLRDSQAFKTTQNWNLFRRPATLIREETIRIAREMLNAESQKRVGKQLIIGERASGKSVLMLQAMSMAYMKDWIVLNIPEGKLITCSVPSQTYLTLLYSSRTR